MPKTKTADVLNSADLAEMFGVAHRTILMWISKERDYLDFPPPTMRVGNRPLWIDQRAAIEKWGIKTGRL